MNENHNRMKRTCRVGLVVGLVCFLTWYVWAWTRTLAAAQALQQDYKTNGAPGAHDR